MIEIKIFFIKYSTKYLIKYFYEIHFKITGYPCNVIGSQRCNLFMNRALSFALNRIFFSANENETVKLNKQSDFKAFLN